MRSLTIFLVYGTVPLVPFEKFVMKMNEVNLVMKITMTCAILTKL